MLLCLVFIHIFMYYLIHEKECFIIFKTRGAAERFRYDKTNLVARARDPLWEESWGSGKKPKRMHGIHCIPLLSDPVHWASAQYSNLTMEPLAYAWLKMILLQRIKSLVLLRTLCPCIKTLNHIESEPVKYLL